MPPKKNNKTDSKRGEYFRQACEQGPKGYTGGNTLITHGHGFFRPEAKVYNLRIVPFQLIHPIKLENGKIIEPGTWWPCANILKHYAIGPAEEDVVCPKTIKKACPICEELKQNNELTKKEADTLKAKDRYLYYVIDIDNDPNEILIYDTSYHTFTKYLEEEIQSQSSAGGDYYGFYFPDADGYDLRVRFRQESAGAGRKYIEANRFDFIERDEFDESVLTNIPDLHTCYKVLPYETIRSKFLGLEEDELPFDADSPDAQAAEEEEAEADESKTPPKTSSKKTKSKPEPEPDECALSVGDRISVDFDGESFKGEVYKVTKSGEEISVKFDDGDDQKLSISDISWVKLDSEEEPEKEPEEEPEIAFVLGSKVQSDFDGVPYKGKIIEIKEASAVIEYEDGDSDERDFGDFELLEPPKTTSKKTTSKKTTAKKATPEKKSSKNNECPAGGVFGVDVDTLTECEECKKWADCSSAAASK